MTCPVAFDDVAQALAAGGSTVHAAEAHGCLCGALCARRGYRRSEWYEELMPEPPPESAATDEADVLVALFAYTRGVLAAGDMEFSPLLPDDEAELAARVEALSAWCQGFLYGFGAAGTVPRDALSEDVSEVLADFAELGRVGAVGSASGEVEEEAYAELVEFVRAAVQLVYEELEAVRLTQPASQSQH